MIKIQNQTKEVIVVFNTFFSVNIPAGETMEIKSEQLQGDDKLFCRYLSNCGEKVTVDYGIKRGGIRGRLYAYYENKSTFSLITMFSVKNMQTLCLEEDIIHLRHILIFKTVCIRKITRKPDNQKVKEENLFLDKNSKKQFSRLMSISIFLLPIAVILLLVCIYYLFCNEFDWVEKTMLIIFLLGIALLIFDDVYHYLVGRKLKTFDEVKIKGNKKV